MTIYSVSDAYKTAIRARTRTDRVTGTLTLTNGTVLNLDAADLMSGSLTLDNQCVTGEELAFGCAYLGQAALNLRTDLSRHAFYGAKLVLHYGLQLPGGRWETVPLGVYTVAEAEIGALNPNAALVCQLSGADGLSTWRECAAAVAQLVGGFAAADRAGRLVLRTFAEKPCAALTAAARSEAAVSDFACHYAALSIETDDGSFAAGRSQDTGLTMRISNMTLAEKGLPATRQQITDNLFAALQKLDYVPATVTMPGDPAFEPGDRVALPMEDGTAPEMLVTHFVWRYRGRQTLKGVGRNPYLGGTTDGATEKALRRLQNSAESKRIVYYSFTNPAELAVQTVETSAVAIAFTAVEDTSAMFLAQLLLDAAPDTGKVLTLTVRYYINDVPVENFAPQQRLETGAHTLALFYPFASVEAGTVTRLSVRLVCAGGTVKIAPYGIKATVTGQGMASETPWDGTLECEETLLPIAIKARSINV